MSHGHLQFVAMTVASVLGAGVSASLAGGTLCAAAPSAAVLAKEQPPHQQPV